MATIIVPLVTKELHKTVLNARFAPAMHKLDDLSLGINPFTCGYFADEKEQAAMLCTQQYDLMLQSATSPTVTEQEAFTTKKIPFPANPYAAGLQL